MDKALQIAFFNQLAPTWDSRCYHDPDKIRCLIELCDIKETDRILDVACGTGVLEPFILQKNPASVLGVDFSSKMIEVARTKINDARVELRCCDVMELTDEEFGCAIIYSAFPHFENRGSLIRQMHRVLRPNGRLMICHSEGKSAINSHHQSSAAQFTMPLPAAHTLASSLEPYFDVDILLDTTQIYAVSGIKK